MGNSPIVSRINGLLAEKGIAKRNFYQNCGITSASYSLWNTGKTTPRMKNLEVIAEYLGTTTDYLLTGLGEKEKAPSPEDERHVDCDIRRIERARGKMSDADKDKMMKLLELSFSDYFSDDYKDDDLNE